MSYDQSVFVHFNIALPRRAKADPDHGAGLTKSAQINPIQQRQEPPPCQTRKSGLLVGDPFSVAIAAGN
jgi:hypothetical protein